MDINFLLGQFTPTDWFLYGYLFISGATIIIALALLKNNGDDDE